MDCFASLAMTAVCQPRIAGSRARLAVDVPPLAWLESRRGVRTRFVRPTEISNIAERLNMED
jgi:hypothetical protein